MAQDATRNSHYNRETAEKVMAAVKTGLFSNLTDLYESEGREKCGFVNASTETLHYSCSWNKVGIVSGLLKSNPALLNKPQDHDGKGWCPIHCATQ